MLPSLASIRTRRGTSPRRAFFLFSSLAAVLCGGALALSACGGTSPAGAVGAIHVMANAAALQAGSGGPTITKVHVDVAPAGVGMDLTYNGGAGQWQGSLVSTVGAQTVTATAYAGAVVVGTGTAGITVLQHANPVVAIKILDTTTRPTGVAHGPVMTSATTTNGTPEANDSVTLTATAVDPDNGAITYSWTDTCGGTFGSPNAASTTWSWATVGPCTITAKATSLALTDTMTIPITTQTATGTPQFQVTFEPAPYIASMQMTGGGLTGCNIARAATDYTCRPMIPHGSALAVSLAYDPMATGVTSVTLTDNCGGVTSAPSVNTAAGTAGWTWTAPATSQTCLITSTVTRDGMVDVMTLGIDVNP